jgi:hypothetical protein
MDGILLNEGWAEIEVGQMLESFGSERVAADAAGRNSSITEEVCDVGEVGWGSA